MLPKYLDLISWLLRLFLNQSSSSNLSGQGTSHKPKKKKKSFKKAEMPGQ